MTIENPPPYYINKLAADVHKQNVNVGWWDQGADRCINTCIQLILTEVAEATEAERKNLMDEKLTHRKGGEVELADAMIRTLDLGGWFELDYVETHAHYVPFFKPANIFSSHLDISYRCIDLGKAHKRNHKMYMELAYNQLIKSICYAANYQNYYLWQAVEEKHLFNKTRQDHTREARAKAHGKKV